MTETMYEKLGISKEVYEFGQTIEAGLKERFSQMDEVAEYNQLKVLHAMQENKVCGNNVNGLSTLHNIRTGTIMGLFISLD